MKTLFRLSICALVCSDLSAAVPLRWTVETSRVQPVAFDAVHGESIALEAAFKSYGTDVQLPATAALYYQTNGMGSAWWTIPASVSSNRITAVFAPTNDPGASAVSGFIGTTGEIFRAAFTLRFRKGPGATPNTLELPTSTIDCASVTFLNPDSAPWSGGGSGGTDGAAVTNIVDGIVASSNLCTVAAAQAMTNGLPAWTKSETKPEYTASEVGALSVYNGGIVGGNVDVDAYIHGNCVSAAYDQHGPSLGWGVSSSMPDIGFSLPFQTGRPQLVVQDESLTKTNLGDIAVLTDISSASVTNGGAKVYTDSQFSTNNAALVAVVTNLAPASAKSVTPHDPVLDCDWVLNVTNGVFYWTVKE